MKKILLLDDNPQNNESYINKLKNKFLVDECIWMDSAERLLTNEHYDVFVIDVMMPTQDLETTDEIHTGFYFYKEKLASLNLKCTIVFWSWLTESSFKDFWGTPPASTHFLHKEDDNNHLVKFVESLLRK
mgnify:CR=1 FL=1